MVEPPRKRIGARSLFVDLALDGQTPAVNIFL